MVIGKKLWVERDEIAMSQGSQPSWVPYLSWGCHAKLCTSPSTVIPHSGLKIHLKPLLKLVLSALTGLLSTRFSRKTISANCQSQRSLLKVVLPFLGGKVSSLHTREQFSPFSTASYISALRWGSRRRKKLTDSSLLFLQDLRAMARSPLLPLP